MILRETQEEALGKTQGAYRRVRKVLLCAHTGFGKSALMKHMLGRSKKSVLYLCHRDNLMEMVSADLRKVGLDHGIIAGSQGARPHTHRIHIGMMQTISKRLDRLPPFEWIVSDEAHLAACDTWASILTHYAAAWHLGMSASPCRLDGKGLGLYYDEIVYGPPISESTARGYLTPVTVLAPPQQVDGQWNVKGSLSTAKKAEFFNRPAITGSAVAEFKKLGPGHQAVVFCQDREHAEAVAQQFREAGLRWVNVDGTMSKHERNARLRALENRELDGVCNVDLLTTGWDCPQVDVGIDLALTESRALQIQKYGRIIRIAPGKGRAYWIDHVGNVFKHGLPTTHHEFSLDGTPDRHRPISVRQCERCYSVYEPAQSCPCCGYVAPTRPKRAVRAQEGELREVTEDPAAKEQKKQDVKVALRQAVTLSDFHEVARRFNYKAGWGFHQFKLAQQYRRRGQTAA